MYNIFDELPPKVREKLNYLDASCHDLTPLLGKTEKEMLEWLDQYEFTELYIHEKELRSISKSAK